MNKESIPLNLLWHIDAIIHLYPVTIVTTLDTLGRVNAAPFSLVLPFCSSADNPQMLLIAHTQWHTARNIEATREFVINYPRAEQVQDVVATSRHYPPGLNELEYTAYSTLPSNKVAPPRIAECYQHIECRLAQVLRPSEMQVNFIADVLDVSLDAGVYGLHRDERIRRINPPVYFGADETMHHLFGKIAEVQMVAVPV